MKGVSHCSKFVWFYFIVVELWWSKNFCSLEESKSYKWVNECYFTIIYVLVFIHAYEIALVFICIYYYYYFSLISTWSHINMYLCALSVQHHFMPLRRGFKEKCPLSGAKTQV